MPKKITRKGWVRKLDKLCGDIVKARDVTCVCCGRATKLSPGHLFSRVAYSTRWDIERNLFCQCIPCNFRHEYDPYPLMKYATNLLGQDVVDELHRDYVTPHKYKDFQLEELFNELSKKYKLVLDTK